MNATTPIGEQARQNGLEKSILARIPQRAFGDNPWVRQALNGCVQQLAPAIRSGKSYRIANAVRSIAYAPTPEQVDDVVGSACETMLSEAYASSDSDLATKVASARNVIRSVVAELRDSAEREAIAPVLLRETVDGYVRMIGLLNKQLADRLEAVGLLAARIASAMNVPAAQCLDVEFAGRLHDIGTLSIPGMMYAANAFERHPVAGAAFLESVPSLKHLAPIVRSHHERFDGRGYPDGLSGAEIPLASRIIAVAATFVDMVSESPVHEAFLPNRACHHISLASGTQFDPDVVNATMHLLRYRQRSRRSA